MGLLETLVVGSYIWTYAVWRMLAAKIRKFAVNHLAHHAKDIKDLQERVGRLEGR